MLLRELQDVGVDPAGGVTRLSWTPVDRELREWFAERAARAGLEVETDRNGNLWAWWASELPGTAFVVGSHLDSVRSGGIWDGPLGVAGGFEAVETLRTEGFRPSRPVAIVAFAEEEGARFGAACLGSRLMTGALEPDRALALTDPEGVTLADALRTAGHDPASLGADAERIVRIGGFVELHIEQGRLLTDGGAQGLAGAGAPVGLAEGIWPHGRWRIDLAGVPNHAGTTALADRVDPVLAMAQGIVAVRRWAEDLGVLATVGRVRVRPGSVNAIAADAALWIDARGADAERVRALVERVEQELGVAAATESWTDATRFDSAITRLEELQPAGALPRLWSGAGHDAGVLALAGIPSAMLLVRNPTGVSHSPDEDAEESDVAAGVAALTEVLRRAAA
jgi:N-carbamoyl-L-amino-acid hydrolase